MGRPPITGAQDLEEVSMEAEFVGESVEEAVTLGTPDPIHIPDSGARLGRHGEDRRGPRANNRPLHVDPKPLPLPDLDDLFDEYCALSEGGLESDKDSWDMSAESDKDSLDGGTDSGPEYVEYSPPNLNSYVGGGHGDYSHFTSNVKDVEDPIFLPLLFMYAKFRFKFSFNAMEWMLNAVVKYIQALREKDFVVVAGDMPLTAAAIKNKLSARFGVVAPVKIRTCPECNTPFGLNAADSERQSQRPGVLHWDVPGCPCSDKYAPSELLGPHCMKYRALGAQLQTLFGNADFAEAVNNCDFEDPEGVFKGSLFTRLHEEDPEGYPKDASTMYLILGADYVNAFSDKHSTQHVCPVTFQVANLPKE
eukprot:Nk52_evm1s1736 gene=Nk52_evmTU1s1736